jgi:hypothetical protein
MFTQAQIESVLEKYDGKIMYAKTKNKSVLGSINDLTFHIKEVQFQEGLANADMILLVRKVNGIPFKAIGFKYPETLLRLRLESNVVTKQL